ncbi:MAG TPA: iron-sulfur cluster assembly accessory protein [Acidocella sp.]|jgi:iron-sulfur cluster assembly protein|nr:iron-sulfur cluster assembly accessory protein [Acidocella sp.]
MEVTQTPAKSRRELPPLMTLSEAAASRLEKLYATGQQGKLLRISVNARGCSGMSYQMDWVDEAGPVDEKVTSHGLTILVDRKATLFLIGSVMDYKEDKLTRGFTFENPNEKGRCGCGESFHV